MSDERRRRREAEATRPVKTVFLPRGAKTTLHHHRDESSWTHVVSGDMVDERWRCDANGELVRERRVLRADQALAAPGDALHRVEALTDLAFVTTCQDGCTCALAADEELEVELAAQADRSSLITAVGSPAVRGG